MDTLTKIKNFLIINKKRIISALILVVFLVVLAGSIYYITIDDGTYKEGDWESTPYAASTYTQNVQVGSQGITPQTTAQELWDQMIAEGNNVQNYLDRPEELEKLMNAEIITQYPKIGVAGASLDGIIEFERHLTNGTSVMLQYIDISTFNGYIESKNTDIVKYFTLDQNGNVLIGVINEIDENLTSNDPEMILSDYTTSMTDSNKISDGKYSRTEYNVSSKSIYYKGMVSQYTMPFQYLWSLVVIGDDKGVALELADLVQNSTIVISIYDNITTTVNVTTNTYNREKKIDVSAIAMATTSYDDTFTKRDSWEPVQEWEDGINYEIKYTYTYKQNTPIIDVKIADVWIVNYKKEYTYQASEQTSEENNDVDLEDTEYIDDAENPMISAKKDGTDLPEYDRFKGKLQELEEKVEEYAKDNTEIMYVNGVENPLEISTDITFCKANYYKHNVNRHEKYTSTSSAQKYVAGTPEIEEKTDKNSSEPNFVTILSDTTHTEARKKITSEISSWLFELLEINDATKNMVDLTKHLINKVLEREKYEVDFNFNIYEASSFNSITYGGTYGSWDGTGTTEDFIKAVAPYAVIDMQQHGIYASVTIAQAIIESGWGKDNIAINYQNYFGMKAKSSSGNEYWDGTRVNLNASEGGTDYFRVYDSLMNSIYDHGRNFHVTATYSAHGVLDCIPQNLGPKEQLRRIAISGYAVLRDGSITKPDGRRTYDVYLYEEFIVKYNLEHYDTMTVDDFEAVGGNQEIVEIAKSKLGCSYVLGTRGPNTFDCSGLVYWTYGQKGINVPMTTQSYTSYVNTNKEIGWDQVQPGDILLVFSYERGTTYGHAGIYLGNDEYIHAPKPGDVVKISSGAKSKFKHVFRFSN